MKNFNFTNLIEGIVSLAKEDVALATSLDTQLYNFTLLKFESGVTCFKGDADWRKLSADLKSVYGVERVNTFKTRLSSCRIVLEMLVAGKQPKSVTEARKFKLEIPAPATPVAPVPPTPVPPTPVPPTPVPVVPTADISALKEENLALKAEISRLKEENEALKAEISVLKAEKAEKAEKVAKKVVAKVAKKVVAKVA